MNEDTCQIVPHQSVVTKNWQTILIIGGVIVLFILIVYFFYKYVHHTNKKFKHLEQVLSNLQEKNRSPPQPIQQPPPLQPAQVFMPPPMMAPIPQPLPVQPAVVPAPIPQPQVIDSKVLDKELSEELKELNVTPESHEEEGRIEEENKS